MKNTRVLRNVAALLLALLLLLCVSACAKTPATQPTPPENAQTTPAEDNTKNTPDTPAQEKVPAEGIWASATYRSDKTFGTGAKTLVVTVSAEEKSVVFTIKTDKDTVGAALLEHSLIAGEEGQYGLYVKTVNGMLADWSVDQTYWGFYKGGSYMSTGVDSTSFADNDAFELVRTK